MACGVRERGCRFRGVWKGAGFAGTRVLRARLEWSRPRVEVAGWVCVGPGREGRAGSEASCSGLNEPKKFVQGFWEKGLPGRKCFLRMKSERTAAFIVCRG